MKIICLIFMQIINPTNPEVDCTKLKYTEEELVYLGTPLELFTGQCKCFHENGKQSLENNYLNGELNGLSLIWFKNGQVQLVSQYEQGKRIGIFKSYFETGEIESLTEYGKNEQLLTSKQWDKSGKLIFTYPD